MEVSRVVERQVLEAITGCSCDPEDNLKLIVILSANLDPKVTILIPGPQHCAATGYRRTAAISENTSPGVVSWRRDQRGTDRVKAKPL